MDHVRCPFSLATNLVIANLYSYKVDHPSASFTDLDCLEDFMVGVANGIKGSKGDDFYLNQSSSDEEDGGDGEVKKKDKELPGGFETARNYWNNFCGWCKRKGHPISREHMDEMTLVRFL
jgi:hypothetical protein